MKRIEETSRGTREATGRRRRSAGGGCPFLRARFHCSQARAGTFISHGERRMRAAGRSRRPKVERLTGEELARMAPPPPQAGPPTRRSISRAGARPSPRQPALVASQAAKVRRRAPAEPPRAGCGFRDHPSFPRAVSEAAAQGAAPAVSTPRPGASPEPAPRHACRCSARLGKQRARPRGVGHDWGGHPFDQGTAESWGSASPAAHKPGPGAA